MTAVDLKEQGNRLFSGRHYDDAAQCYTKAIVSKMFEEMPVSDKICRTGLAGTMDRTLLEKGCFL